MIDNFFSDIYPINKNSQLMEIQVRMNATFSVPMDLRKFPFDVQELCIRVRFPRIDKQGIQSLDIDGGNCKLQDFIEMPDWICLGVIGDVNEGFSENDTKKPEAIFKITVARRSTFWFINIILPMGSIGLLLFYGFVIPREDGLDRMNFSTTIISLELFFKFVITGRLPAISYLTLIDKWILMCFGVSVVTTMGFALASMTENGNTGQYIDITTLIISASTYIICSTYFAYQSYKFISYRQAYQGNGKVLSESKSPL